VSAPIRRVSFHTVETVPSNCTSGSCVFGFCRDVAGCRDVLTPLFLDFRREWDVHPVAVGPAGSELTVADPVVDGVVRDPEPLGDLADGQLIAAPQRLARNSVVGAQLADRAGVERTAGRGAQTARVDLSGELTVAAVWGQAPEQVEGLLRGAPDNALRPGEPVLFGRA
jgi:hypothetical protein